MKTSRTILVSLLVMAGFPIDARHGTLIAAAPDHGEDPGAYAIGLQVSQAGGRSTWRYTIDKTTADTKDLGHFILDLDSCGIQGPTMANIVSASVDGVDWSDQMQASEGRTGCDVASPNFVKFDNLPAADTHVVEFTLDDVYPPMDTTAWLKRGRSCTRTPILGPGCRGYLRTSAMEADASLVGKLYGDINTYMRRFGFDYTEHPNCTGGFGGDINGVHGDVDVEPSLDRYAFRFHIHIDPVIDGDRCSATTVDRQRNEMKSITNNSTWAQVQGNWDEWQILEWDPGMEIQAPDRVPAHGQLLSHSPAQGPGRSQQREPLHHHHPARQQLGREQASPDHPFRRWREHRQGNDRRQRPVVGLRGRMGAGP